MIVVYLVFVFVLVLVFVFFLLLSSFLDALPPIPTFHLVLRVIVAGVTFDLWLPRSESVLHN